MLYGWVLILHSYPEYRRSSAPMISSFGGEGGIRTHVRAFGPQVDFESTPLRPLRYLSAIDRERLYILFKEQTGSRPVFCPGRSAEESPGILLEELRR